LVPAKKAKRKDNTTVSSRTQGTILHEADFAWIFSRSFVALIRNALDTSELGSVRKRLLDRTLVVQIILVLALFRQHAISVVISNVITYLAVLEVFTDSALYCQRKAIGWHPLEHLFEEHARSIEAGYRYKGLRVLLLDGSSLNTQDTDANREGFGKPSFKRKGQSGAAGYPQVKTVTALDAKGCTMRQIVINRHNGGERSVALQMVERYYGPQHLLIWDSGFSGAPLFEACLKAGTNCIGRVAKNWKAKKVQENGPGDWIIEMRSRRRVTTGDGKTVSAGAIKLTLRLVEFYIVGGALVRLYTTLLDPQRYPADEIIYLYSLRWQHEEALDEFKTHLAGPAKGTVPVPLRGRTPEMVRQEIYALLIVYNMVRVKMQTVAQSTGSVLKRISFIQVLNLVRLETLGALLGLFIDTLRVHKRAVNRDVRPRHYPRVRKKTHHKWPDRGPGYQETVYEAGWQSGSEA
jgi:hypothetical protein